MIYLDITMFLFSRSTYGLRVEMLQRNDKKVGEFMYFKNAYKLLIVQYHNRKNVFFFHIKIFPEIYELFRKTILFFF